jgi:dipeptidyl aminopeptidase/acylaminoacyl peptidase
MKAVLKPEDLARFKSVGEAQVSPDGSGVAYAVSAPDRKSDRSLTSIWLVPAAGGKARRLTNTGKDRSPRWSPDGRRIAFVSERSGKPQTWIIDVDGGEAWHLSTEQAVRGVVWSPDGKSIVFTSRDFTKLDTWVPYPGAPELDRKRAVDQAKQALPGPGPAGDTTGGPGQADRMSDVKVITRFRYRADGAGYLGDLRSHIFIVSVPEQAPESGEAKGSVRRLTSGDFDHDAPSFSPDGRYIIFTALCREDADYLQKQDIWLVEIATGRLVLLYEGQGPVYAPAFSPGGTRVAFGGHDNSHSSSTIQGLWVLDVGDFVKDLEGRGNLSVPCPLTQADARNLIKSLDRPLGPGSASDIHYGGGESFQWESATGLLFLAGDRGATTLYRVSAVQGCPKAQPAEVWGEELRNLVMFDQAAGHFVFQLGAPDAPEELYSFDEASGSLTRLTNSNPWLGRVALGRMEKFTYKGADGWDIDGWLTYPVDYEPGKQYPVVLTIHGGPAGAYGPNFTYQSQIFAGRGFAVLGTNPRGSSTYTQEFTHACVGDWGGKDYQDIMAGVDEVIERGIADPARLFVTGWSYGGFMTSWVVTQTDRFKAAIAGAVITDRYSMWGTQDITLFGEYHFGGTPWDNRDALLERSAIAYVKNVKTPVMILHGELDIRCPTSQGEEFYMALKRLGKTAIFVRYPGEYHGFTRLSHRLDRYERMVAWFDYYAR